MGDKMLGKLPDKSYASRRTTRRIIAALLSVLLTAAAAYLIATDFNIIKSKTASPTSSAEPEATPTPVPTSESTSTPAPTPTPTPPPPGKKVSDVIVVVDPGHGGRDPGTVSPYVKDFYEKEITLDMGLMLRDKLEEAGIRVVMTRETDKELATYWKEDVWARPRLANEVKATFFVSIHVNSIDIKKYSADAYHGTSVYHYGKTHGELTSKQIGLMMSEEIDAVTETQNNGVLRADLGVLRLSEMPALLIEAAYMTNKEDHKLLESDEFREAMVDGIFNGTVRILEEMGSYMENGEYKILTDE